MKLAAIVNSRPSAIACCSKISSASGSPCSPYAAHQLGRLARVGSAPAGGPGYRVSQYGSRLLLDAGQRGDALRVADEAAVAPRAAAGPSLEQAVHRDVHVAELAGHAGRAA